MGGCGKLTCRSWSPKIAAIEKQIATCEDALGEPLQNRHDGIRLVSVDDYKARYRWDGLTQETSQVISWLLSRKSCSYFSCQNRTNSSGGWTS